LRIRDEGAGGPVGEDCRERFDTLCGYVDMGFGFEGIDISEARQDAKAISVYDSLRKL